MDNWISVDERLPELEEGVKNTSIEVIMFSESNEFYLGYYNFYNKNWYYDGNWIGDDITHWQPLPKPPKLK